jgi:hypothetical protein
MNPVSLGILRLTVRLAVGGALRGGSLIVVEVACAQPYHFTTLPSQSGGQAVDGTNNAARFGLPCAIARDQGGTLYIADSYNNTIRKTALIAGKWVTTTIAGLSGYAGIADGTNNDARFNQPAGIAIDNLTNLYVADSWSHTIRKIAPVGTNWVVTTIAGFAGFNGTNDGFGSAARFFLPSGIAVDSSGTIYVADTGNDTIRKIVPSGSAGTVTTIAGLALQPGSNNGTGSDARFSAPAGIALDNLNNLYVADAGNFIIRQMTQSGGSWTVSTIAGFAGTRGNADGAGSAASFGDPEAVCLDNSGNLYAADTQSNTIRQVTFSGGVWNVATIAGQPGIPGSTDATGTNALFYQPQALVADASGNLFIADTHNATIRRLTAGSWSSATIAGSAASQLTGVRLWAPAGMTIDPQGNYYVADSGNHVIRRLTRVGSHWQITTVAGQVSNPGSADGTGTSAQFNAPRGVCADAGGTLYVADSLNYTIRRITPVGTNWVVSTIVGQAGFRGGANGTNSDARFYLPYGVAVDGATNVYVTDMLYDAVRKVTPVGTNWVVTLVAGVNAFRPGFADGTNGNARFSAPVSIAVDAATNLWVADSINSAIRKITPIDTNWVVTTPLGRGGGSDGTNMAAGFSAPYGIAIDPSGALYVADQINANVRKITPIGTNLVVTTLGGKAGATGSADGTGSNARFNSLWGIAADPAGNVCVSDYYLNTIRFGEPVPSLELTASDAGLLLSWPLWASNYVLQAADNAGPACSWQPWTNPVTLVETNFFTTNSAASPAAFFRLFKPPCL